MKKLYRFLLPLVYIIIFQSEGKTQLTVEIGPDTTYCKDLWAEPISYLGSKLSIENGVGPYQYAWDCFYDVAGIIFTASSFLNDTTLANPYFTGYPIDDDWLFLTLNVKDAEDNLAKDSINVRFSRFSYVMDNWTVYLPKGDSILLSGDPFIGGGIYPLSICWTPEIGLVDPCTISTWCKPDNTTFYYQVATDFVGCISEQELVYEIFVQPVGTESALVDGPNNGYIRKIGDQIKFSNPLNIEAYFTIYSLNGQIINKGKTSQDYFLLPKFLVHGSIFIISVRIDKDFQTIKINY
jgi:hypothetical protein